MTRADWVVAGALVYSVVMLAVFVPWLLRLSRGFFRSRGPDSEE